MDKILKSIFTSIVTLVISFSGIDTYDVNLPNEVYILEKIPIECEIEEVIIESEPLSNDDICLLSLLTMAEAENQSELGKRLVIDTVLNRVDSEYFCDSVYSVVYESGQFTSMTNGRVNRCYVKDDILQLVKEELQNRTNYDVLYFRKDHYHNFGTPLFSEGDHYFSTR